MGAWENKFQISQNEILRMKFYLYFHNAYMKFEIYSIDTGHLPYWPSVDWELRSLHCLVRSVIPSQIVPFVVRSFHSFSVKLDVWVHFFGFLAQRIRYTHEYHPCFCSWLNCRTILLFCGMILLRTIWPWNKVTGFLDWYTTKYHPVAVDMFSDTWLVLVY